LTTRRAAQAAPQLSGGPMIAEGLTDAAGAVL